MIEVVSASLNALKVLSVSSETPVLSEYQTVHPATLVSHGYGFY